MTYFFRDRPSREKKTFQSLHQCTHLALNILVCFLRPERRKWREGAECVAERVGLSPAFGFRTVELALPPSPCLLPRPQRGLCFARGAAVLHTHTTYVARAHEGGGCTSSALFTAQHYRSTLLPKKTCFKAERERLVCSEKKYSI